MDKQETMSSFECPKCGYDIWVQNPFVRDIWPPLHVFFCWKCGYALDMKIIEPGDEENKKFFEELRNGRVLER